AERRDEDADDRERDRETRGKCPEAEAMLGQRARHQDRQERNDARRERRQRARGVAEEKGPGARVHARPGARIAPSERLVEQRGDRFLARLAGGARDFLAALEDDERALLGDAQALLQRGLAVVV